MNFFDYLKEAKDEVVKAKKTKIEYADGAWGVIPTMTTLDVKDLAKSGKIKEYTNLDQKTNPWLMKNLAAAKPMQEGMIKTFPSIVVSESKPIILLIITLLKRMKESDKITEKVISIVKAGAAKYPKGRKEDVNEAFEIESQAFTKGIIARSNEVVLYCNTADGGTLVKNNLFRTLDQLVKYVSEYKNWLETKDSENDDTNKIDNDISDFEKKFKEQIEGNLIAPVGSVIKDDFKSSVDKVVGFSNAGGVGVDPYIALLGKVNGKKYRLAFRLSAENVNAVFSSFEIAGNVNVNAKDQEEIISEKIKEYINAKKKELKPVYDRQPEEKKKAFGDFEKFFKLWFNAYKEKEEYKTKIADIKKEAKDSTEAIDVKAIRKYVIAEYADKELKDEKIIPHNFYTLKSPLDIKASVDGFDAELEYVTDSGEKKNVHFTNTRIDKMIVGDIYRSLKDDLDKIKVTNILKLNTSTNEKAAITFEDAKEGKFKEEELDNSQFSAFNSITDMFSSSNPKDSAYLADKKNNEIILKTVDSASIKMKGDMPYISIVGKFNENGVTKTYTTDFSVNADGLNQINKLFTNAKQIVTALGSADKTFEEKKKTDKNFFAINLSGENLPKIKDGGKKVLADEKARVLTDKNGYIKTAMAKEKVDDNGEVKLKPFNWEKVKMNKASSIKANYKGVSKINITSIK